MSKNCDLCHGSLDDIYKQSFLELFTSVNGNLNVRQTSDSINRTSHCYDVLSWTS